MINERMGWSPTIISRRSFRLSAAVVSQIPARSCPERSSSDAMTPIFLSARMPSKSDWSNLGFFHCCRGARLLASSLVCRSGSFWHFQDALLEVAHPKKDRSLIARGGLLTTPGPIKRKRGSAWICPVVPHRPSCQSVRALFLEGFPRRDPRSGVHLNVDGTL